MGLTKLTLVVAFASVSTGFSGQQLCRRGDKQSLGNCHRLPNCTIATSAVEFGSYDPIVTNATTALTDTGTGAADAVTVYGSIAVSQNKLAGSYAVPSLATVTYLMLGRALSQAAFGLAFLLCAAAAVAGSFAVSLV